MNITIEELFNKYKEYLSDSDGRFEGYFINGEDFRLALIEYGTKVLKYAAEKVLLNSSSYKGSYTIEGSYNIDDYTDLTVDKDSILNIIKELK